MKNLFLLLFISFISLQAFSQQSRYSFFYEATFVSDTTDQNTKGRDLMVLWSADNYSVFQSYYGFVRDSIILAASKGISTPNQSNIGEILSKTYSVEKPAYLHIIHKDFVKNRITVFDKLFFDNYQYNQNLSAIQWKLHKEYKEHLGYNCQKATCTYSGRNYIAWFAEGIPVQDGPYVFTGLPGLIMEIEDEKNYFSYSLIAIGQRSEALKDLTYQNTISLSKKDYFRLKKELYADVSKGLISKPSNSISAQDLKAVQERYNKVNNPLELNP
jgi:GLPGLI family protein